MWCMTSPRSRLERSNGNKQLSFREGWCESFPDFFGYLVKNDQQAVENLSRLWKIWLLSGVISLFLVASPVLASVHTYPEPDGVMYRSLSTFQDNSQRAWQSVFYKRFHLGQPETLHLRLIGFPGAIDLIHPAPLEIATNDKVLTVSDITPSEFPTHHVGEYDFKAIVTQLDTDTPLKLVVQTKTGTATLKVPSEVLLEWWRVASWQPNQG